jgi:hypothetical protein
MERKFDEYLPNISSCSNSFDYNIKDFAVFDFLRGRFYENNGTVKQKIILFFCGSVAGICALTATVDGTHFRSFIKNKDFWAFIKVILQLFSELSYTKVYLFLYLQLQNKR